MTSVETIREQFKNLIIAVNPDADLAWLDEMTHAEWEAYLSILESGESNADQ